MSSYDHYFDTVPAEDTQASTVDQSWNQNLDPNPAVQQSNPEIEQNPNKCGGERTSAFAELFEDLHRYIQQEQILSNTTNESSYSQNAPVYQNRSYQCNTFTPIQNMVQFPCNLPVHATYPQLLPHNSRIVHRAHISLVPTANGTLKTITKRKRKRTIFTTEQVEELEKYFCQKPYVTREDRQVLVQRLNINDKAVKIWFQNRRLKGKRDQCQSPLSDNAMSENNIPEFHLDYIESQITEKADQFGYVTLDDATMGNLVNIIDSCLCNSTTDMIFEETSNECEINMQSSPIYEPISPPDSMKEEEYLYWQPQEPTESLQTLLDFQNISQ